MYHVRCTLNYCCTNVGVVAQKFTSPRSGEPLFKGHHTMPLGRVFRVLAHSGGDTSVILQNRETAKLLVFAEDGTVRTCEWGVGGGERGGTVQ
jgi:hypothetical protein